jgi:sugar phosphate isomerase/epimerase
MGARRGGGPRDVIDRREFVRRSASAALGLGALGYAPGPSRSVLGAPSSLYEISLAQWSLHRMIRSGELDALDFAVCARREFDIGAVEYVNQFFADRAEDASYLAELGSRADGSGVRSLLIMIDGEGRLGDPDSTARTRAIENHYRWVEAARFLRCHSIRVNAESAGTREAQRDLAIDGLGRLTEFAADREMNVIVENHRGLSSDGSWLTEVMRGVDHPRCGTLPDFGNFDLGNGESYDKYLGVEELMPFAKAVSAKSYAFGEDGSETTIDFLRMMRIVVGSGYGGYVGIEYEGTQLGEIAGIRATQQLLERVRDALEAEPN